MGAWHARRVLLRHNVTAIPERYILKLWRWDTLLLDNEGSAEVGPAVSAEVSVAVRAQVSDKVAEVAGVVSEVAEVVSEVAEAVSEVAQVAAAAVSIMVAEEDATPARAAAFADFQHHVQRQLPVPPVVRNPAAVAGQGMRPAFSLASRPPCPPAIQRDGDADVAGNMDMMGEITIVYDETVSNRRRRGEVNRAVAEEAKYKNSSLKL
ncbi:hypothetical protein PsorP6_001161 [Peronosclerospora sorghi]|uniref:Uncharacterized protein n=1 Tax=Peronosclerospora sorghi TaxID=230839 RepID=A0ACC0WU43_9STRA|nr:hypothetical protein PsorP6_001161 [Peronosclerospora sorghi]